MTGNEDMRMRACERQVCSAGARRGASGGALLMVAALLAGLWAWTGEPHWLWLAAMAAGSALLWWGLVRMAGQGGCGDV